MTKFWRKSNKLNLSSLAHKRVRWAEHVAPTERVENIYKIRIGKREENKPYAGLAANETILKWILKKQGLHWHWRVAPQYQTVLLDVAPLTSYVTPTAM